MADQKSQQTPPPAKNLPSPAEPVAEPHKELSYGEATSKLAGLGINWQPLVSKILTALVQEIEAVLNQGAAAQQTKP